MKRVIGFSLVGIIVLGGIVYGVGQTPWWTCRYDTSLTSDDLGYETADQIKPELREDLGAAELEELPGVGDLRGGMSSDVELTAQDGADGAVLSQSPYFAESDLYRDVSLDPASGEILWNRGQPGQHDQVGLIDDQQISVTAVRDGGSYRVTALDPETGRVAGCVNLERGDSAGIGKLRHTTGPDGSDLLLTYPAESDDVISLIGLEDHQERWSAALDFEAHDLREVDGVAIAGLLPPEEILVDDKIRNHWRDGYRPMLTAFDAGSGESQWQWPASDSEPVIATMVGVVDGDDAAGDESLVVLSAKSMPDYDPDERDSGPEESPDHLLALDATTGEEVWSSKTFPSVDASIVEGQILYSSAEDYGALDTATGQATWQHTEGQDGDPLGARHATAWTAGTALVATRDGGLAVIDLDTGELTATAHGEIVSYYRFYSTDDHLVLFAQGFVDGGDLLVFARE